MEEAKQFHLTSKTYAGDRTFKAFTYLDMICREYRPQSLLDWGCGKGLQFTLRDATVYRLDDSLEVVSAAQIPSLEEALGCPITGYDPAVVGRDVRPVGRFDGVYCVDVMPVIPAWDLDWFVQDMASYARQFLFAKFRCNPTRDKKTHVNNDFPLEFWTELFVKNTPPELDLVLMLRHPDKTQMYCRRRPHGPLVVEPAKVVLVK